MVQWLRLPASTAEGVELLHAKCSQKKKKTQKTRIGTTERGRAGGRERPQRTEHAGKEKGLTRWWEGGDGLSLEPKRSGSRLPPPTPHLHYPAPRG